MLLDGEDRSQLSQIFQKLRAVQTEAFSQSDVTNLANKYMWRSSNIPTIPLSSSPRGSETRGNTTDGQNLRRHTDRQTRDASTDIHESKRGLTFPD